MSSWKRALVNDNESAAKKREVIVVEVKCKWGDRRNGWPWVSTGSHLRDSSYGTRGTWDRSNWQKRGKWWWEKDGNVPEEEIQAHNNKQKNFTLKELSKIFHIIESGKDQMLAADPDLGRCGIVCQMSRKNACSISSFIHWKWTSTTQTTFAKFLQRNKTLWFSLFLVI